MNNFDELLRAVMADAGPMMALTSATTEAELFALVVALGRERGINVTAAELTEIVRANRRAWLERWLVP